MLYWSDWGQKPYIKRATLDGLRPVMIADSGLGWPNGLCLDYSESRLYWADARTDRYLDLLPHYFHPARPRFKFSALRQKILFMMEILFNILSNGLNFACSFLKEQAIKQYIKLGFLLHFQVAHPSSDSCCQLYGEYFILSINDLKRNYLHELLI